MPQTLNRWLCPPLSLVFSVESLISMPGAWPPHLFCLWTREVWDWKVTHTWTLLYLHRFPGRRDRLAMTHPYFTVWHPMCNPIFFKPPEFVQIENSSSSAHASRCVMNNLHPCSRPLKLLLGAPGPACPSLCYFASVCGLRATAH